MGVSALILFRNYNIGTQQVMGGSPCEVIPRIYSKFRKAHCPEQAILNIIKENGNVVFGEGDNKMFTGYDFVYKVWYTGKTLFIENEDLLEDDMIQEVLDELRKEFGEVKVEVIKERDATLFEIQLR
ncbi:hypothetical protein [Thermococcus sp. 9N3]|uniref:hypothetical protein n=1 Tax=Thermococcus sp. 9N3 TaxID=163002 RepID=UPI00142F75C4|nr:hypothetical protein [Thermococcus sp. 9N3]NJE48584.1 hypothetical protein [Thermococcus sp. 9N3]